MFTITRRGAFWGACFGLALAAGGSVQAQTAASGPILLTVTGAVSNPNRGGFDPETDKFFGFNEVSFDAARQFGTGDLDAMGKVTVKADFPKGGPVYAFEGVLMADLLAAAGAEGKTITVQALDGYAVDMAFDEMIAKGAVVAMKRDGKPLGIGDFGPTQIVFPRAERADLADLSDDAWVWSIFHIKVE